MYNSCFGEMEYDYGWITKRDIQLFGKTFEIEVRIVSNDSEDGISEESEQSCLSYKDKEIEYFQCIEKLMLEFSADAETRFTPCTLFIKAIGSCALLCSDVEDDDGIAVCIIPEKCVKYQCEFL